MASFHSRLLIIIGKTLVVSLRLEFSSFTMLPRAVTYSPVQQIDEDDSATEKLGHRLNPQTHLKISRYGSFWIRHWAYFTHGVLLLVSVFFFCLWIRAHVQIPKFAMYCKSLHILLLSESRVLKI
jgi:hypothetical protein